MRVLRAVALVLLAGCADPSPPLAVQLPVVAVEAAPQTIPMEFESVVRLTQSAVVAAKTNTPLEESCLSIAVPRGWVPVVVDSGSHWEAQSPLAQELWLGYFEGNDVDATVAVKGASPQAIQYAFTPEQQEDWRALAGSSVHVLASQATHGALVRQEVTLRANIVFLRFPEWDDVPHVVPCFDLGVL